MAVLTQHRAQNADSEILANFRMGDALAHGIGRSIQGAAFDHWSPESSAPLCAHFEIEKEYLPEGTGRGGRFTFVCQVEPTVFLALSACCFDPTPSSTRLPAAQEIHGWVDAHLRLLWQLKQDSRRAEMLARALDLFDFGTLILDGGGTIVFCNEQASQLLDAGDGLRRAGQSVTATDFEDAVRLQTAIHHLSHNEGGIRSNLNGASLLLIRRSNARPLVAVLARLCDIEADCSAATVLYVLDPDIDTQPLAMALSRAYGLTTAEAGLTIRLVAGLTIDAAAAEMRIKTQTARAYLKQIFAKTDTHRQADLVRVILGSVVRIRSLSTAPANGGTDSSHRGAEHAPVWG